MHADLRIGDSILMMNDHFPEFGAPAIPEGTAPLVLRLYVPVSDALFAKTTVAGCQVAMPLSDAFWGDRDPQRNFDAGGIATAPGSRSLRRTSNA